MNGLVLRLELLNSISIVSPRQPKHGNVYQELWVALNKFRSNRVKVKYRRFRRSLFAPESNGKAVLVQLVHCRARALEL